MNAGTLPGIAGPNLDVARKKLVDCTGLIVGAKVPPIGTGNQQLGATSPPGVNAVNPGNVRFDEPRITTTGHYRHSMMPGSQFYGCWVLNDTIEAIYNGGTEMGGLYVRPEIHVNDGSGSQLCVGQDIVLTVRGTTTVDQTVSFGPASLLFGNVNNAYGVRSSIQTPDSEGNHIGKVDLFQGLYLNGSTTTVGTLIGLDLSLINAASGNISNSWGIQVGSANNYFAGLSTFGATTTPIAGVDSWQGVNLHGVDALKHLIYENATITDTAANVYYPFLLQNSITWNTTGSIFAQVAAYDDESTYTANVTLGAWYGVKIHPTLAGTGSMGQLIGLAVIPNVTSAAPTAFTGIQVAPAVLPAGSYTAIGLSIPTMTVPASAYAMQIGGNISSFIGPILMETITMPTSTTGGNTLAQNPVLVSSGTYNVVSAGSNTYTPWLINDTITFTGTPSSPQSYALGIYPSFNSSITSSPTVAGIACNPSINGTDTYSTAYGLTLNAVVHSPVTNLYGVSSFIFCETGAAIGTASIFFGQALKIGGTFTTLIGLNLTNLSGATTIWGMQIGNYQSYHQGKMSFGGTSAPISQIDLIAGAITYHNQNTVAYAATISVSGLSGNIVELTTSAGIGNATINDSDGAFALGMFLLFIIHNDATAARTITFGTNFHANGTLVGTISKTATICFINNGGTYYEVARTLGLTT